MVKLVTTQNKYTSLKWNKINFLEFWFSFTVNNVANIKSGDTRCRVELPNIHKSKINTVTTPADKRETDVDLFEDFHISLIIEIPPPY